MFYIFNNAKKIILKILLCGQKQISFIYLIFNYLIIYIHPQIKLI
jgi:hypothetical protein